MNCRLVIRCYWVFVFEILKLLSDRKNHRNTLSYNCEVNNNVTECLRCFILDGFLFSHCLHNSVRENKNKQLITRGQTRSSSNQSIGQCLGENKRMEKKTTECLLHASQNKISFSLKISKNPLAGIGSWRRNHLIFIFSKLIELITNEDDGRDWRSLTIKYHYYYYYYWWQLFANGIEQEQCK